MRYGLEEIIIKKINDVFSRFPEIKEVILYGSRAMGNHKKGSDIDLTILSDKIEMSTLYKIERELDDLLLPYTIDLSVHRYIQNPNLLSHIKNVGSIFYSVQTRPNKLPKTVRSIQVFQFKPNRFQKPVRFT